jgi:hypothetical protein
VFFKKSSKFLVTFQNSEFWGVTNIQSITSRSKINLGEYTNSLKFVKQIMNIEYGVLDLDGDFVKRTIIDTHPLGRQR